MRSTKEWIGKTDDAKPPPKVRLRVFETHKGICFFAGRKIMPGEAWDCHHVKELWDGGENRESNLAPALRKYHQAHSARQQTVKAEVDNLKMKNLGIKKSKRPQSKYKRKIDGTVVDRATGKPV